MTNGLWRVNLGLSETKSDPSLSESLGKPWAFSSTESSAAFLLLYSLYIRCSATSASRICFSVLSPSHRAKNVCLFYPHRSARVTECLFHRYVFHLSQLGGRWEDEEQDGALSTPRTHTPLLQILSCLQPHFQCLPSCIFGQNICLGFLQSSPLLYFLSIFFSDILSAVDSIFHPTCNFPLHFCPICPLISFFSHLKFFAISHFLPFGVLSPPPLLSPLHFHSHVSIFSTLNHSNPFISCTPALFSRPAASESFAISAAVIMHLFSFSSLFLHFPYFADFVCFHVPSCSLCVSVWWWTHHSWDGLCGPAPVQPSAAAHVSGPWSCAGGHHGRTGAHR